MENLDNQKLIATYLKKLGYNSAVICGQGVLVDLLIKELSATNFTIDYIVSTTDCDISEYNANIPVHSIKNELPSADIIILCVPLMACNLKQQLIIQDETKVIPLCKIILDLHS